MTTTSDRRDELMEAILKRAASNREFRARLVGEPRAAIYEQFGVRIPDEFRIRFIEKGNDVDSLVVLPDFEEPSDELSEDDLEEVAGGVPRRPTGTRGAQMREEDSRFDQLTGRSERRYTW